MTVRDLTFVFACLVCASQARRVQLESAAGEGEPLKALGMLLSQFNSAAAFNPSVGLRAHAVHEQQFVHHRASSTIMEAPSATIEQEFAAAIGMDYDMDKNTIDRMISLGVKDDVIKTMERMASEEMVEAQKEEVKEEEPSVLDAMLAKAVPVSSLLTIEPAPAPAAPAPVEKEPEVAPAPVEKEPEVAPAPVEATPKAAATPEVAKPKEKANGSKKKSKKKTKKQREREKLFGAPAPVEAKPEAEPKEAEPKEFVSVPTGLVWPSDEAEALLREVDGIKMYPTHAWTEKMAPVVAAKDDALAEGETPVMIGVAADSGCGKSTFLRRILGALGTDVKPGHTAIGDMMTVVCLDDYHTNDRAGRKATGLTALDAAENDFDLMGAQMEALKAGKAVYKPIYNHDTGNKDPPELLQPNKVMVFEGLHPIYDSKSREVLDMKIYIDIVNDVKFAWKVQRDVAERGWTEEQVKEDIEKRLPDFSAFVDPQKADADVVLRYEPSEKGLPGLKVKLIQKKGGNFPMVTLKKGIRSVSLPSAALKMYDEDWFGNDVTVLELDGTIDKENMEAELKFIEGKLEGLNAKSPTELTESMLKLKSSPGSDNGTGLFQNIIGMKVREVYEKLTA